MASSQPSQLQITRRNTWTFQFEYQMVPNYSGQGPTIPLGFFSDGHPLFQGAFLPGTVVDDVFGVSKKQLHIPPTSPTPNQK